MLSTGISTGSVTGNYLERRQQHSELRSNDIALIQEHNQSVTGTCLKHNQNVTKEYFTRRDYLAESTILKELKSEVIKKS